MVSKVEHRSLLVICIDISQIVFLLVCLLLTDLLEFAICSILKYVANTPHLCLSFVLVYVVFYH